MHWVIFSPSGISTLSIELPSWVTRRSLRVPSFEVWTSARVRPPIVAFCATSSRNALDRLVISSKLPACFS